MSILKYGVIVKAFTVETSSNTAGRDYGTRKAPLTLLPIAIGLQ
jgi:hypothetical protein